MNILLSYSKYHWNPGQVHYLGGAGFLSSQIYQALENSFPESNIVYMDYCDFETVDTNLHWDLFLGIATNFDKFARRLGDCVKILIAVNAAPLQRLEIVGQAIRNRFPLAALQSEDGIYSLEHPAKSSDLVILLGNTMAARTYEKYINYSKPVIPITINFKNQSLEIERDGNDILYFPGTITFRKGISSILDFLEILSKEAPHRKLILIGRTSNTSIRKIVEKFEELYPNQFEWVQEYIDETSDSWEDILSRTSFAVFPSLEEGIPATVGELVNSGVPVLYSNSCGLNFAHRVDFFKNGDRPQNIRVFRDFIGKKNKELDEILDRQQAYLNSLTPATQQFIEIFNNIDIDRKDFGDVGENSFCEIPLSEDSAGNKLILNLFESKIDSESLLRLTSDIFRTHCFASEIEIGAEDRVLARYHRIVAQDFDQKLTLKFDVDLIRKTRKKMDARYLIYVALVKARDKILSVQKAFGTN